MDKLYAPRLHVRQHLMRMLHCCQIRIQKTTRPGGLTVCGQMPQDLRKRSCLLWSPTTKDSRCCRRSNVPGISSFRVSLQVSLSGHIESLKRTLSFPPNLILSIARFFQAAYVTRCAHTRVVSCRREVSWRCCKAFNCCTTALAVFIATCSTRSRKSRYCHY